MRPIIRARIPTLEDEATKYTLYTHVCIFYIYIQIYIYVCFSINKYIGTAYCAQPRVSALQSPRSYYLLF